MKLSKLEQRITYLILALSTLILLVLIALAYGEHRRQQQVYARLGHLNETYFSRSEYRLSLPEPAFTDPSTNYEEYGVYLPYAPYLWSLTHYQRQDASYFFDAAHLGLVLSPSRLELDAAWRDVWQKQGWAHIKPYDSGYPSLPANLSTASFQLDLLPISVSGTPWPTLLEESPLDLDSYRKAGRRVEAVDIYDEGFRLHWQLDTETGWSSRIETMLLQEGVWQLGDEMSDLGGLRGSYPLTQVMMPANWAKAMDSSTPIKRELLKDYTARVTATNSSQSLSAGSLYWALSNYRPTQPYSLMYYERDKYDSLFLLYDVVAIELVDEDEAELFIDTASGSQWHFNKRTGDLRLVQLYPGTGEQEQLAVRTEA
jgi:hypothetical protein